MADGLKQKTGIICKGIGGLYYVEAAQGGVRGGLYACRARGIFRKDNIKPLAGDYVRIEPQDDVSGTIVEILERKNFLRRPAVANIDWLMIVASVAAPAAGTLLIDRLSAFAAHRGIASAVVISKADLDEDYARRLSDIYKQAGFPVFVVSSERQDDLAQLRDFFEAGKVYAFAGNSGVGKTTLINRLDPSLELATGEISDKLGRGRHTTRQVELFHFLDGFLVDTPGFSAFEPERGDLILKEDLPACFGEFAPYLDACRFTSCAHMGERGCAVCGAVEEGHIPLSRYKSYETMYNEVKDIKDWEIRS